MGLVQVCILSEFAKMLELRWLINLSIPLYLFIITF